MYLPNPSSVLQLAKYSICDLTTMLPHKNELLYDVGLALDQLFVTDFIPL